jgi:hypothetical protein
MSNLHELATVIRKPWEFRFRVSSGGNMRVPGTTPCLDGATERRNERKRLERAAETRKTHRNNLFATLKDQGFEAREPTEEEKANHKYATTQDPIWLEGELVPFADVAEELNEGKDERGY